MLSRWVLLAVEVERAGVWGAVALGAGGAEVGDHKSPHSPTPLVATYLCTCLPAQPERPLSLRIGTKSTGAAQDQRQPASLARDPSLCPLAADVDSEGLDLCKCVCEAERHTVN